MSIMNKLGKLLFSIQRIYIYSLTSFIIVILDKVTQTKINEIIEMTNLWEHL